MEDLLKAFIDFLTDIFAALAEFLGSTSPLGDILGGIEDIIGGEEATGEATE